MKKKKITGIILAGLMCAVTVLTGCALTSRNMDEYYNAVVATITTKDDTKINITKKELIDAYNSYGYYYEQYYGYSRSDAVEQTLAQLESRKLLINAATEEFADPQGNVLSDKEKTYLWQQTNTALQDNLRSYLKTDDSSSEESASDDNVTVTKYEKQGRLIKSSKMVEDKEVYEYRIEKTKPVEKLLQDFDYVEAEKKDVEKAEDKLLIYENLIETAVNDELTDQLKTYYSALKTNESGLKFDDYSQKARFFREIDRIYKINYENYITEKYSESFKKDQDDKDANLSDVTVQSILQLYSNKVLSSFNKYEIENSSTYENDVLSDLSSINYFKEDSEATKFYTVSHILIKFNDEQSKIYSQAQTDLENDDTDSYEANIARLKALSTPIVRQDDDNDGVWELTDERKVYQTNVDKLYSYIYDTISGINDPIAKAEKFKEFIYTYNEDPGIMTAEYNYVMGLNRAQAVGSNEGDDGIVTVEINGKKVNYKSYSNMVIEFTNAGAELYNDGNGKIGDLSPLVMTENGFHILMYTGECKNYFSSLIDQYKSGNTEAGLQPGAIDTLYSQRINVCVNKTIFDKLYDELTKDNFATFESANSEFLKEGCQFDHYPSNYSDLI